MVAKKILQKLTFGAAFITCALFIFAPYQQVFAVTDSGSTNVSTTWDDRPVEEQVKIYQSYSALMSCFAGGVLKDGDDNRINVENAALFNWFNEWGVTGKTVLSFLGDNLRYKETQSPLGVGLGKTSLVYCSDHAEIKSLLKVLGDGAYSGAELLCRLGFDRNKNGGPDGGGGGCQSQSPQGDFYRVGTSADQLSTISSRYKSMLWGGKAPYLTKAAEYYRYNLAFKLCASPESDQSFRGTNRSYLITTIDDEGTISDNKALYYGKDGVGKSKDEKIMLGGGYIVQPSFNTLESLTNNVQNLGSLLTAPRMSCEDLADKLNKSELIVAYAAYIKERGVPDETLTESTTVSENSSETSCVVQGVGWIICPVVNFMAGIADATYSIIEQFLKVDVSTVSTDPSSSGTYQAWAIMRNIANVLLVIAFLFIIFSQLTGAGVSNYGIKKTLPRIVVGAILINVSFFICQIGVDLSNILGATLKDFLANLPVFADGGGNWAEQTLAQGNFFTNAAISILGAQTGIAILGASVAAGYFLGLGIFIPVIVAVIIAVLMTFFILLARQMLIVLLIVVAPVAFAAMLLPNTEKWAKWWQKAFIGILVIYPMIAILFGGAQLASNILVQAKGDAGDLGWQLIAACIAILPLFFVPALLKGSLNAVPIIGNAAQKLQTRAVGAGRKWSGVGMKKLGEYSASRDGKFGRRVSGAVHGNGMMGRLRQASAQRAYEEPRMKDLMTQWTRPKNGETKAIADDSNKLAEIASRNPSSFEGQAALSMLAGKGEAPRLAKIRTQLEARAAAPGASREDAANMAAYNKAIASQYGALKARHPGAVQRMGAAEWAGVKQSDMQGMKDDALLEGIGIGIDGIPTGTGSAEFKSNLARALTDPEQERYFSPAVYGAMGITPPSITKKETSALPPSQDQSARSGDDLVIPRSNNTPEATEDASGPTDTPPGQ